MTDLIAQAEAWLHLKPFGYAPGNYMCKCQSCKAIVYDLDKRAITCRPCAEKAFAELRAQAAEQPAQAIPVVDGSKPYYVDMPDGVRRKYLPDAVEQPAEAVALEVHLGDMHESNGRVTWVVSLCRAGDSVFDGYQIYADTIKGRAEYEAAALKHLLGQGPKPDLLAFDTDPPLAAHPDPRIVQLEGLLRDSAKALRQAKVAIKGREHTGFIDAAIERLDAALGGK